MIVNYSDEKVQEHDIPKVFFTSDTHFSQERTFKFSRRPFNNVKEMDETIIANWNNLVKENDTVFHLGDFGNYSLVEKLNGNIIFCYFFKWLISFIYKIFILRILDISH